MSAMGMHPAGTISGIALPSTNIDVASEALLKERFQLLLGTSAGSLARLQEELIRGLDEIHPAPEFPAILHWARLHDLVVSLTGGLTANLKREDGEFEVEVPELGIIANGEAWADAQRDLFDQLEVLVDRFGSLPGDKLTKGGLAVREKLVSLGLVQPL
jgi:hypothetical protein